MELIIPAVGLALGLGWVIFRTRYGPATDEERERWASAAEARRSQKEENNAHI